MKTLLTLADLNGYSQSDIIDHIVSSYQAKREDFEGVDFLIAYESVGDYGCDSSSWFLFEKNGKLYENHASHCSCYGFEGQWTPEETTIEYLVSDKFYLPYGGYDNDSNGNEEAVKKYLIDGLGETIKVDVIDQIVAKYMTLIKNSGRSSINIEKHMKEALTEYDSLKNKPTKNNK